MIEDAEVDNRTSSTTKLAENLLASVDMVEDAKVGKGNVGDNKTIEKLPSKKLSRLKGYLTSLCFGKKMSSP